MTENNFISVIIPVYNRAWCIHQAIDSVLDQTYKNIELIIVDDGSDDETGDILKNYEKNHGIVKVLFQENKGVSAARNFGIKNSRGDFIAFLDSDDFWEPKKLEIQVDYFIENKTAIVCQTEEIWIRKNKRINPKKRHKKPFGDIFIPSLSLCLVSPSAVMMKREFFYKSGLFDEKMIACEDYDLWLRASLLFDFHLIESPLVVKRGGHEDQLSSLPFLDKFRIYSIKKILDQGISHREKEVAAIEKAIEKSLIYMEGCKKRFKMEEYFIYKSLKREMEEKL
ncbi:MAG: glycosyltransferase family 2 protein [Desulforegulaceae bacterium]|nr:glycosyltransferase family 2 protein [Desulforegulaceae bacterium]